jgi:hypothetical protein
MGLDQLRTYGILREIGKDGILAWIDALARVRLLASVNGRVSLTSEGIEVMYARRPLPAALEAA